MKKILYWILSIFWVIIILLILLWIFWKDIKNEINISDMEIINNSEVSDENNWFIFLSDFESDLDNDNIDEQKAENYLNDLELLASKNYTNNFSANKTYDYIWIRTVTLIRSLREFYLQNSDLENVLKLDYFTYNLLYKLINWELSYGLKSNFISEIIRIYDNRIEANNEYQIEKLSLDEYQVLKSLVSYEAKKYKNYYEENFIKIPFVFNSQDIYLANKYNLYNILENNNYEKFEPNYFYKNPVSVFFIKKFPSLFFKEDIQSMNNEIREYNEL